MTPSSLSHQLTLSTVHRNWTTALLSPPTSRLSTLRPLLRTLTTTNPSSPPILPPRQLALLYLDLGLTYAFLGEHYLASLAFQSAITLCPSHDAVSHDITPSYTAFSYFALGLTKAELGEWRAAKGAWKRCLRCFESGQGRRQTISYPLFHLPQERNRHQNRNNFGSSAANGAGVGEKWILERTRVEWNFRIALFETGSKKMGIGPRGPEMNRLGLNGVPAGVYFGPGWEGGVERFTAGEALEGVWEKEKEKGKDGVKSKGLQPLEEIGKSSSPRSARSPPATRSIPSTPTVPKVPASFSPLGDHGSYKDSPTLGRGNYSPSLYSPSRISAPPPYEETTSSSSIIHHECAKPTSSISARSTIPSPLSYYFSNDLDEDGNMNDKGAGDVFNNIDEAMALWSGEGETLVKHDLQRGFGQKEEQQTERSERFSGSFYDETSSQDEQGDEEEEVEILLPRTFEGFGPAKTSLWKFLQAYHLVTEYRRFVNWNENLGGFPGVKFLR